MLTTLAAPHKFKFRTSKKKEAREQTIFIKIFEQTFVNVRHRRAFFFFFRRRNEKKFPSIVITKKKIIRSSRRGSRNYEISSK